MTYSTAAAALRALGETLQAVHNNEKRLNELQAATDTQLTLTEESRKKFNKARDEVLTQFPEIIAGYPQETVTVVDGKITVVSEERS